MKIYVRSSFKKILCLFLALALTVAIPPETMIAASSKSSGTKKAQTALSKNGRLKVKKTSLVNSKGKAVILKGVSTHGINWFPEYVNPDTFKTLRDKWGVNCIRLAMYTEEYNGYCSGGSKKNLKSLINKGVKYATDLGMYVIIDWHILSDGNPKKNKKQAAAFSRKWQKNTGTIRMSCMRSAMNPTAMSSGRTSSPTRNPSLRPSGPMIKRISSWWELPPGHRT